MLRPRPLNGVNPMTARRATTRRREAGFTLIDMMFVVALVGLLMTMAIPGLMRARGAAQVASAIGTMRPVNSAQLSYAITCGLGFYAPDFPTLGIKPPSANEAFLGPDLTSGPTFNKSGYNFSLAGTALRRCAGDVQRTWARARHRRVTQWLRTRWIRPEHSLLRQQRRRPGLRAHPVACGDRCPRAGRRPQALP